MKKNILLVFSVSVFIIAIVITVLYIRSINKELKVYKAITEIPFKDQKITILGKDIVINDNQKYYIMEGDCSSVENGSDWSSIVSFQIKEEIRGSVGTMLKGFDELFKTVDNNAEASYFDIVIFTRQEDTGYENKDYHRALGDKATHDKNDYSQVYYISLTCTS